jgi:hypothetical protein
MSRPSSSVKRWPSSEATRCPAGYCAAEGRAYDPTAAEAAKKALESDPKLVEAQELLARLALEGQQQRQGSRGSEEGSRDGSQVPSAGRADPRHLTGSPTRRTTTWDPQTPGYRCAGVSSVNRRIRRGESSSYPQVDRARAAGLQSARSQMAINLMRLGQDKEAFQELETSFNNGWQDPRPRIL